MTVSALRLHTPRITTSIRSKRARRFWASMSGALREASRRPGEIAPGERTARAVRVASYEPAWRTI